jgi:hypothetical protein
VHGGYAGGVDDAGDLGFAGEAEKVAGAINVGAIRGVGIANPEAIICGYVHYGVATGERWGEGLGMGEIADDRVARNAFEVFEVAGFADKETEFCALSGKSFGDVVAYESGGACEENFHG